MSIGLGIIAAVFLTGAVVVLQSDIGARLVSGFLLRYVNDRIVGALAVSGVSGPIVRQLTLDDVTLTDAERDTVFRARRAIISYSLRDLFARRFVVQGLTLEEPRLVLIEQEPGESFTALNIFPSTERPPAVRPPLVVLHEVQVRSGQISVTLQSGIRNDTVAPFVASLTEIDAIIPTVRVSSPRPGEEPLAVRIQELGLTVSQPDWGTTALAGRLEWLDDSLQIALPLVRVGTSRASIEGWVRFIDGAPRVDLVAVVDRLASSDLSPVVPSLPEGLVARGRLAVETNGNTYQVEGTDVEVTLPDSGIARGEIGGAIVSGHRWTSQNTQLSLQDVQLDRLVPWLDSLALIGLIDGSIEVDGPRDSMSVAIAVEWRDLSLRRHPRSTVRLRGLLNFDDLTDVEFGSVRISELSIPLSTVQRLAPDFALDGYISARGDLTGSTTAPHFRGQVQHRLGIEPPSVIRGNVALMRATRSIHFAVDARLDSLRPHTWSPFLTTLPLHTAIAGRVAAEGTLDSVTFDGLLEGEAGAVSAVGVLTRIEDGIEASHLMLEATNFDPSHLDSVLPEMRLNAHAEGTFRSLASVPLDAVLDLRVDSSSVSGEIVDSARVRMSVAQNLLEVDTIAVWSPGLHVSGGGEIGITDPRAGTVTVHVLADSSTIAEKWLARRVVTGTDAPTNFTSGPIEVHGVIDGGLEDYAVVGSVESTRIRFGTGSADHLVALVEWRSNDRAGGVNLTADSVRFPGARTASIEATVKGVPDSLGWRLVARTDSAELGGGGSFEQDSLGSTVSVDSLRMRVRQSAWTVAQSATLTISRDNEITTRNLLLERQGGRGRIAISGGLTLGGDARLETIIDALPVDDVFGVLPVDSSLTPGGLLHARLRVTGTPDEPVVDADLEVVDARLGSFRASRVTGTAGYRDRDIAGAVEVWGDSARVLTASGRMPIDLALREVDDRRLPGPIEFAAQLDTVNLADFAPFFPGVRRPEGVLTVALEFNGTVHDPILTGYLELANGAAGMPNLGVRYRDVSGRLHLGGDTVRVERFTLRAGDGTADVLGSVHVAQLDRPVFDLRLRGRNFRAMDVPDFLSLTATGEVSLKGPIDGMTATVRGSADRGVLWFADLLAKQIVNLSDTIYASFVDTSLLRSQRLEEGVSTQFLDNLNIDTAEIDLGNEFWMRSSEANIQLTGQLLISKRATEYRINGTLTATRGTYRMQVAPGVVREFTVLRGRVGYFGTPDLNADLDIDARHVVRTFRNEPIAVLVHIGGTLYAPRLELSSDVQPALSDTEIVSYLIFGTSSVRAFAGQGGTQGRFVFQQSVDRFAAALSEQVEQSVVNGLGLPLDYLQIRPGDVSQGFSDTEIAIGKQINVFGRSAFLTASPRLCPRQRLFSAHNVGASVETWLGRQWLLTASVDPFRSCETSTIPSPSRYQLGIDLLWEKRE